MSISKVETPPFCCQIGGSNIKSIADFHAWRIEAWCKKIALIIKKKCTVAGVCKNMETNKTRMTNCKYSWPFWLMMEVTDEVIGQWKWAMSSQKLIKHMLIIVTMNRKVKKEILRKWAKQGQATSVLEFLCLQKLLFRGLFCRYFADFDMKNEEIWQLLRKSEDGVTCWINGLVMRIESVTICAWILV